MEMATPHTSRGSLIRSAANRGARRMDTDAPNRRLPFPLPCDADRNAGYWAPRRLTRSAAPFPLALEGVKA